jgi:hypothetical protein
MVGQGIMEGGTVTVSLKNGELHFDVKKGLTKTRRTKAQAAATAA